MGTLTLPPSGTIYVDTNSLIYFVEKVEPYLSASRPLWDEWNLGVRQLCTSELTLLETLVKPLRTGDVSLAMLYRATLLNAAGLTCVPVSRKVLEDAATIRALHRLSVPDAIHAATAQDTGCVLLVTNDPIFRRVPGLNVAVLDEIIASP